MNNVFDWVVGYFIILGVFAWVWGNVIGGIIALIPNDDKGIKIDFRQK